MIKYLLTILVCTCSAVPASSQTMTMRQPNLHAPQLYADKIDFSATLVDLPGAQNKQSYWELSYQLYFIPEARYYEALRGFPQGGYDPTPEEFPGRILLTTGHQKKSRLATPQERAILLTAVNFKDKVPDVQRTKFGILLTAYSVKIFDGELNKTIYDSGIFLTHPYETQDQKQDLPRKTLYLTFSVTPKGTLNYSQLRPRQ
jgi:hypothetical protein